MGNIVRINPAVPQPEAEFPHATEDCILSPNSTAEVIGTVDHADLAASVEGSVQPSLQAAFGHLLIRSPYGKCHVASGAMTRSLSAINVNTANVTFYVDSYDPEKPKLRARVADGGLLYDVTVPASTQRKIWKEDGLEAVLNEIRCTDRAQLRVGLCRAFGGKCYAQVNGIIAIPNE